MAQAKEIKNSEFKAAYLSALSLSDLESLMLSWSQPKYRAKQIEAFIRQGVSNPEEWTSLPKALRTLIQENFSSECVRILQKQESALDGTVKYALLLSDNSVVEAVLMRYRYGNTLCLSSQVGCAMGCLFCASTGLSFKRNLTRLELLSQIYLVSKDMELNISRVVIMGIGEPLANLHEILAFAKLLNHEEGFGISARRIAVSTCGLVPGIDALAASDLPLTLALSLHAPDDERRAQLMPINKRYPLKDVLAACKRYQDKTHRRVSYEYIMFQDFNDRLEDAQALVKLIKKLKGHINLIPANYVEGSPFLPSSKDQIKKFSDFLTESGLQNSVRRSLGQDIDAACGQLRRSLIKKKMVEQKGGKL